MDALEHVSKRYGETKVLIVLDQEALRRLHTQSNIARYLNTARGQFMQVPVQDYFSAQDVRNFFARDLAEIKQVMGIQ